MDGLPRAVCSMANPENPQVAELAIREGVDRILCEVVKIIEQNETKETK